MKKLLGIFVTVVIVSTMFLNTNIVDNSKSDISLFEITNASASWWDNWWDCIGGGGEGCTAWAECAADPDGPKDNIECEGEYECASWWETIECDGEVTIC